MALVIKTTAKTRQDVKSNSKIETKLFDFGDPSMTKSFSRCSVSYSIDGNGVAPLGMYFKLDNELTWTKFRDTNDYKSYLGHVFLRSNGKIVQKHFDFPRKSIGTKVQIKICWDNAYSNTNDCKNFKLTDISFTYRGLNRK